MKKIISIILILSLMTLISCTDKNAQIYSEHMADTSNQNEENGNTSSDEDVPEITLSGTLKISTDEITSDVIGWYRSMQEFLKIHPDVKIELNDTMVEYTTVDEYLVAVKTYSDDLKVQMASGNTPDLIIDSFGGDYTSQFVASGLLYDFNEFIENDPEFIKDDYYMNVIKAQEINGGLYRFPIEFEFSSVRLREDILNALDIDIESIKTVDYKFLFDVYDRATQSGEFPNLKYIQAEDFECKAILYKEEMTAAYDAQNMEVSFNSPEFIEYLTATNSYTGISNPFSSSMVYGDMEIMDSEDYFAQILSMSGTSYNFFTQEVENITMPIPIANSKGEIYAQIMSSMSIPKNAENSELAWEFIKYHIGETEEAVFLDDEGEENGTRYLFPAINREFYKISSLHSMEYSYEGGITYTKEQIEGHLEYVDKSLENPVTIGLSSIEIKNALQELVIDFYNGLMTAEECANAMQDRAEIYFAEIG